VGGYLLIREGFEAALRHGGIAKRFDGSALGRRVRRGVQAVALVVHEGGVEGERRNAEQRHHGDGGQHENLA
jgi:hypothetical protein